MLVVKINVCSFVIVLLLLLLLFFPEHRALVYSSDFTFYVFLRTYEQRQIFGRLLLHDTAEKEPVCVFECLQTRTISLSSNISSSN